MRRWKRACLRVVGYAFYPLFAASCLAAFFPACHEQWAAWEKRADAAFGELGAFGLLLTVVLSVVAGSWLLYTVVSGLVEGWRKRKEPK